MNPADLLNKLGGIPDEFTVSPARSSSAGLGSGWKLTSEQEGGIQIRWSPGSARPDHPSDPYWVVSSGRGGTAGPVEAGTWPDGPEPYVTPPDPGPEEPGSSGCLASYHTGSRVMLASCGGIEPGPGGEDAFSGEDPLVE